MTRLRRKRLVWVAGIGVLVVVVMCTLAVLYPAKPYRFLKGSAFQDIDIVDPMVLGLPSSVTTPLMPFTKRSYASNVDFDELLLMARDELKPQGFTETRMVEQGLVTLNFVYFEKGGARVSLQRISEDFAAYGLLPEWAPLIGKAKTFIVVTSDTNLLDRLQDKLHRDRLR